MATRTAGYTSSGIRKLAALPALLPEFHRFVRLRPWKQKPNAIIGWGLKPTSVHARQYAQRHQLPYIALEDGFIRSLGLGVNGFQPHSLVVDETGIYYDASRPSDLENWLNTASFDAEELAQAERCMALIARYRLSKYNHAPDQPVQNSSQARVLVVDQTAGDASIHYGGAQAESFQHMLEAALAAHPESEILVKIHPDVIAGKNRGICLTQLTTPAAG